MHIVFNVLTLRRGGAERVLMNLAGYFQGQSHKVSVVMTKNIEVKYPIPSGIACYRLDKTADQQFENKVTRFLRRRRKLRQVLKGIQPDLVVSFLPEPNFLVLSLKRYLSEVPIVVSVRNDPAVEYKFLPYAIMMRWLYPKASGHVFQTEVARDYFRFDQRIFSHSRVIPNAVDRKFIDVPLEGKTRSKRIVAVGKLEHQKNHALLIQSFARIAEDLPGWHLHIYGEGTLEGLLQSEIEALGMRGRVTLEGESRDILRDIADGGMFVMASDYEGMPNALIEAMALGLPVICTDCASGGPAYLIDSGKNGLLTAVGDGEALAEAMKRMALEAGLAEKLGTAATQVTVQLHPDKINEAWGAYLDDCMGR